LDLYSYIIYYSVYIFNKFLQNIFDKTGMPREIPKRLINYSIAFIIAIIAFVLFFWLPAIDAFIFIAFALSSLALVYSMDILPNKDELLEIPQVHHYYKQRINSYGYAMAAMLVVISVLYSILAVFLNVRSGVAALIVWVIAIISTYFISKLFSGKVEENSILDYVDKKVAKNSAESEQVKVLVSYLISSNVDEKNISFHEKNIKQICSFIEIDEELANQSIRVYLSYRSATSSKVSSSEINAINKR
jgi:putative flippase GtrA